MFKIFKTCEKKSFLQIIKMSFNRKKEIFKNLKLLIFKTLRIHKLASKNTTIYVT